MPPKKQDQPKKKKTVEDKVCTDRSCDQKQTNR